MCDQSGSREGRNSRTIPVSHAVGTVLAHDITEIRPGEFKGAAFRKGHVVREEDVCHLQRLGKEHLFVLEIGPDEMHEDEAAHEIAMALMGEGVEIRGEPREGKISIVAGRDGLLQIDREALLRFNLIGEVMCATLHDSTVVRQGQDVAGTRAIPLVIKKAVIADAVRAAGGGVISVLPMRKLRAGVVITGSEVYHGRVRDAFGPVIEEKVRSLGGEIVGLAYAPDDRVVIEAELRGLIAAGADLLITTGGMSVDPDDVTRHAIAALGAEDITYGSAALPGAMFLVAYISRPSAVDSPGSLTKTDHDSRQTTIDSRRIPVLGIPACGMYAKTTVFDVVLPQVLAGRRIGRKELAALGHGGLCLRCEVCRYPVCPFGKG